MCRISSALTEVSQLQDNEILVEDKGKLYDDDTQVREMFSQFFIFQIHI